MLGEAPKGHSSIKLHFGEKLQGHTQLDFELAVDFFSEKSVNFRFNTAEYLKTDISPQSFLLICQSKSNDVQGLAKAIQQSQAVTQINDYSATKLTFIGKGGKIYIIGQGEQLSGFFESINQMITPLKGLSNYDRSTILRIQSLNHLSKITELCLQKGAIAGYLDSLQITLDYMKSPLLKQVVKLVVQNIFGSQAAGLYRSLSEVNIELNCSSANILQHFDVKQPQIGLIKQSSELYKLIKQRDISNVQLYLFSETVSAKGTVNLTGLQQHLGIYFE